MNASRTTITEVEPLAERWLRLTFGNGAVHEVDLADGDRHPASGRHLPRRVIQTA